MIGRIRYKKYIDPNQKDYRELKRIVEATNEIKQSNN